MELEKGEKKRVKKTKSLHSFFSKEGRPRPTVYRHVSIHTQIIAFFKCAKVVSLSKKPLCRTKKKKSAIARRRFEKTTTKKKTVVVAHCLSGWWSFASTGKARKRREKVLLRVFCFFSPSFSRIFCVFPEVKNTTTRGGDRDKKSPKRSKKRERCATKATKTETDVRAENEKTRKEERSKKRQPKASAKTKSFFKRAREGKTEKRADPQPKRFCLWDDFLTVLWAPSSLLDKTARRASWSTRWDGKKSASNASKTRGIAR